MARSGPIEPPTGPLTDGVVAVRLRRTGDVDAIAAASHDPQTRRWLDDDPMDAPARRTSLERVEQAWRSGRAAPLVIADAVTDEPVGITNLQFRDDEVATVAYSVFPAHRGHGIAPRAVRLLAGWAFADLGLDRVLLEADEENAASLRVAEKCGFERIGSRTEPGPEGGPHTTVVFARTADRTRAARSPQSRRGDAVIQGAVAARAGHAGGMNAPVRVQPPGPGGRRVVIHGQDAGLATGLADVLEFLRRAGLDDLDEADLTNPDLVEWRGPGPDVWT
jgi:RimJ/RimL family protein N-acetyltransferase